MKKILQMVAVAAICVAPASARKLQYGPYALSCSSYSHVVAQGHDAHYHFHTARRARIELSDTSGPGGHPILRTERANGNGDCDVTWRVGSGARIGPHTITAYAYKSVGDIGARSSRVVLRVRVVHGH
jgi:hypothetical protein